MDIGDVVPVADVHDPAVVEEVVPEAVQFDQGGRKPEFPESAQHSFV